MKSKNSSTKVCTFHFSRLQIPTWIKHDKLDAFSMKLVVRIEFSDPGRFDKHARELDDRYEHDHIGVTKIKVALRLETEIVTDS